MKQKIFTIVILIMSLWLILGGIAGLTVMTNIEKPSDDNTIEFMATVKNVEIRVLNSSKDGVVRTEEYSTILVVPNVEKTVDINDFNNLQSGQTIFFKIDNIWADQFEEMMGCQIVSLRTEKKEILTLNSYNEYKGRREFRAVLTVIIFCPILLLISIHCILLLNGVNVFRRFRK